MTLIMIFVIETFFLTVTKIIIFPQKISFLISKLIYSVHSVLNKIAKFFIKITVNYKKNSTFVKKSITLIFLQ